MVFRSFTSNAATPLGTSPLFPRSAWSRHVSDGDHGPHAEPDDSELFEWHRHPRRVAPRSNSSSPNNRFRQHGRASSKQSNSPRKRFGNSLIPAPHMPEDRVSFFFLITQLYKCCSCSNNNFNLWFFFTFSLYFLSGTAHCTWQESWIPRGQESALIRTSRRFSQMSNPLLIRDQVRHPAFLVESSLRSGPLLSRFLKWTAR